MIGESKLCLEEGGSPSPVQGSACLKRFVTILTHVSRWRKKMERSMGRLLGRKEKEKRQSGEQGSGRA